MRHLCSSNVLSLPAFAVIVPEIGCVTPDPSTVNVPLPAFTVIVPEIGCVTPLPSTTRAVMEAIP